MAGFKDAEARPRSAQLHHWTMAEALPQNNRSVVITGTKGLARHAALALTRAGAEVVLAGYKRSEGEDSLAAIRKHVPSANIHLEDLDLTDLGSVTKFAERMKSRFDKLDVLLNNAGVIAVPTRSVTSTGMELHFATNFLGHFALTAQLMPLLRRGTDPRVVTIGSLAARRAKLDFSDLQSEKDYRPMIAYGRSKLAELAFALELHRRSVAGNWGVASMAAHPGLALDLQDQSVADKSIGTVASLFAPLLFQPAATGVLPMLFASVSPGAKGGYYYGPRGLLELRGSPGIAKIPAAAKDEDVANRLWDAAKQLTSVDFDVIASGRN